MNQQTRFQIYKQHVIEFNDNDLAPPETWRAIYDWYKSNEGRNLFIQSFQQVTGIRVNLDGEMDQRIASAIPKSIRNSESQKISTAYYKAHAELFLCELDYIVSKVPRNCSLPQAEVRYRNVIGFARKVMMDSLVLFQDWGLQCAKPNRNFGVDANCNQHIMNIYHGAKQTIYGHGSFGLSFSDNHSALVAATIRQAIEIRLRRAFGIIEAAYFTHVPLKTVRISDLLELMKKYEKEIEMPIPIYNLYRIYYWANVQLHLGIRDYSWTHARIVNYLRTWLIGIEQTNRSWTVNSGIQMTNSSFAAIRKSFESEFGLLPESNCNVILEN